MDMHTLLYLKMENQQGPKVYSTRNSAQCHGGEWIRVYYG